MKTLLIDNFDSFTFNLYQLIAQVNRIPPVVIRNDSDRWPILKNAGFDNIVLSPGPGRPDKPGDFGICSQVIREASVPVLGVCLGHQGLCHVFGGEIDYLTPVMHGRISDVFHDHDTLFSGIPSPFKVVRYHSLHVTRVPDEMRPIAHTADGVNMAVRHRTKPIWGVQFHPESVCTEYGRVLLENFRDLSRAALPPTASLASGAATQTDHTVPPGPRAGAALQLYFRRLTVTPPPEQVFMACYSGAARAFWLDSECYDTSGPRFSFMGDTCGPHAEFIRYQQRQQTITLDAQSSSGVEVLQMPLLEYLDQQLRQRFIADSALPFDFNLGYIGYLGYEMKGDCGYTSPHSAETPDACMIFADRLCVFDHTEQVVYLVCGEQETHSARAIAWLDQMQATLQGLAPYPSEKHLSRSPAATLFQPFHDDTAYLALIARAKHALAQGESYEICLTNELQAEIALEPLALFRKLRWDNPAPYASYLCFDDLAIVSCSPERFLSIDQNGRVETKPIKGTRGRGRSQQEDADIVRDLQTNEKDRAENLMIVDLLRNDLGQVSEVGSVNVRSLFAVETYQTVHQLVSTVEGRLRRDSSAVDCLRACFPGGSMTGAPKKRTLEIIDDLEGRARGVYAGAIGYFALNGSADFSIVIRTLVYHRGIVSLGVGGAIVDLSDPVAELEETRIKAAALLAAIAPAGDSDESVQA